jgi:hypothetical protein
MLNVFALMAKSCSLVRISASPGYGGKSHALRAILSPAIVRSSLSSATVRLGFSVLKFALVSGLVFYCFHFNRPALDYNHE